MALLFESVTCTRCGGTGKYSFNLMDGDRCYGCSGTGVKLTKRGAAAQAFLNDLRAKPVTEVEVGMKVYNAGIGGITRGGWMVVEAIEYRPNEVLLRDPAGYAHGYSVNSKVRVQGDAEYEEGLRRQALAFQDTLTARGLPRKVRGKAS